MYVRTYVCEYNIMHIWETLIGTIFAVGWFQFVFVLSLKAQYSNNLVPMFDAERINAKNWLENQIWAPRLQPPWKPWYIRNVNFSGSRRNELPYIFEHCLRCRLAKVWMQFNTESMTHLVLQVISSSVRAGTTSMCEKADISKLSPISFIGRDSFGCTAGWFQQHHATATQAILFLTDGEADFSEADYERMLGFSWQ